MKDTRGIIILLYYTEKATLKQILNWACPTAQRLALCVLEFTETLQRGPIMYLNPKQVNTRAELFRKM